MGVSEPRRHDPQLEGSLRRILEVLVDFADDPDAVISRIGGGKIAIPEDRAQDLDHFLKFALAREPRLASRRLIKLALHIDRTLDRKSRGGAEFERGFWSNRGFRTHAAWRDIRRRCQAFFFD